MTQFTLNGKEVEVGAHPHLLAALREELDVTSPKDGCSPSGQCGCCTVLIDGKASVSCQISLEKAAGKSITTLEGFDAVGAGALRRRVRSHRGASVRLLHAWHPRAGQGTHRQEGLGPHPGRCRPLPRRASVPLHRLQQDPRRGRGPRRPGGCRRRSRPGASARGASSTRASSWRSAIATTSTTSGSRHAARRPPARRPRPSRRARASTPRPHAPCRVSRPCSPPPTSPVSCASGIIHTDWPVLHPRGRAAPRISATSSPSSSPTRGRPPREASKLVDVTYQPLRPITDAVRRDRRSRGRGLGARRATCSPARCTRGATSTPPSPARCPHGARGLPDPARRARLPRARVHARRAATERHPAGLLGRSGGLGRPQPDRLGAGDPGRAGRRRAGLQRRRLRRQGGHVQPGPDGPCRLAAEAGR